MAFLNLKKKKPTVVQGAMSQESKTARKLPVVSASERLAPASSVSYSSVITDVIIRPRVTEKAAILSAKGREVHVFEVSRNATKRTVAESIRALYKVLPEKVALLKIPPKKSFIKGRLSKGKTGRKAYVYLREGDKIEN